MSRPDVSVVIPAFNARGTIGRAVRSALAQPRTAEVIVVDDASSDGTRTRVDRLAAENARVRVIALSSNKGPAHARNRGIDAARGAWVALLDADDFFLPGRLARLQALPDHEMAADDIAFVSDDMAARLDPAVFDADGPVTTLSVSDFAAGNLAGGRQRGEMGFLKPLISRAFLDRHDLRYDDRLRLGEDVDLYLRALIAGARFVLVRRVGYCALVRSRSLSARHAPEDLAALCAAVERQALRLPEAGPARRAVDDLAAQLRRRRDHRVFLERKAAGGMPAALRYALAERGRAGPIAWGILRDKLRLRPAEVIAPEIGFRTLLGDHETRVRMTASSGGMGTPSGKSSPGNSSTTIRRAPGK